MDWGDPHPKTSRYDEADSNSAKKRPNALMLLCVDELEDDSRPHETTRSDYRHPSYKITANAGTEVFLQVVTKLAFKEQREHETKRDAYNRTDQASPQ